MKQKDLLLLIIAGIILLGTGYVAYTQLMPKNTAAKSGVEVEVVGVIPDALDSEGMQILTDPKRTRDFNSPVDLSNLDNTAPFGR